MPLRMIYLMISCKQVPTFLKTIKPTNVSLEKNFYRAFPGDCCSNIHAEMTDKSKVSNWSF